jgi:flavin reductase (DIM6/NTAB) family NADH-FMN oxidoreductase RutF/rubredoxin
MINPLLFKIPCGIFLITTESKEILGGCIVNTVMQISDFPTNFIVTIDKKSHTANLMLESRRCIIGLISEHFDFNIINHFLKHSGNIENKFDAKYNDLFTYKMYSDMPCLDQNIIYNLICDVKEIIEVDDHYLFILRLQDTMTISKDDKLMNYEMFVSKNESDKLIEEKKEEEKKIAEAKEHARTSFVCTVCKYVYVGSIPFEELPNDYKCPKCGKSKDFFIEEYLL